MQQRFWPDPQPLVERLGRDFFRRLPETPGVYLMHGAADAVLYVGKAKNLRHRVNSYRVANPERMARRTLRLLQLVERLTWEECPNETTALRRESELLLTLKPRFNRAGVWPGQKRFLGWRTQPFGIELAVLETMEDGWTRAGPFGALAIHLHRALVRLMWLEFHANEGMAGMPAGWFNGQHGLCVTVPHSNSSEIQAACEQLSNLAGAGGQPWPTPQLRSFEQSLCAEDVEIVAKHLSGRMVATT